MPQSYNNFDRPYRRGLVLGLSLAELFLILLFLLLLVATGIVQQYERETQELKEVKEDLSEKLEALERVITIDGKPITREEFEDLVEAAQKRGELLKQVEELNKNQENLCRLPWPMRIGIHSGPLMAGIVGKSKISYDVWGDTVNIASRFEKNSEEKRINISESMHYRVKQFFDCTPRGPVDIKGKGATNMFWLDRIKKEYSGDEEGLVANERFLKLLSL